MKKDYFEPDERWRLAWEVNSMDEYIQKFVCEIKFNSSVPEDIKQIGIVVEHLLVYSYYKYEMYDEAVRKMLNLFELSVRLKSLALGNKIEIIDKNGKSRPVHLGQLVLGLKDDIRLENSVERYNDFVYLRNHYSHPMFNSFSGSIHFETIKEIMKCINFMFLKDNVGK